MSFAAGDAVLLRSIHRGNVRWCFPHRYVGEWEGRLGIYCQPGNRGKVMRRTPGGRYLERWVTDVPPDSYSWDTSHVLRFMRPGDSHTVEVWDTSWVIAEQPWPPGWEDWRPPADWAPLALPEDWHLVGAS